MHAPRATATLLLLALVGCRGTESGATYDTSTWPLDSGHRDDSDTGPEEDPSDLPAFWGLSGRLVISGGEITVADSSLSVSLHSEAGAICTASPTLEWAVPATPPEAGIHGWWQVRIGLSDSDPCALPDGFQVELSLGIGALDTQLYPAMDANGYETTGSGAYGLYVQLSGSPVWVFGLAGTPENFAGTTDAVSGPPLPDGVYQLEGLHLLPL